MRNGQPPGIEVGGAALAASAAAAAPTILLGPFVIVGFPLGLLIAGGHMLLLGLPIYLLLRRRVRVDWMQAIAAGFAIGALPVMIWQVHIWGLVALANFGIGILFGGFGAIAGSVFRLVLGEPIDPAAPDGAAAAVFE